MHEHDNLQATALGPGGFIFPGDPSLVAVAGDWHANTAYALRALRHARKQGAEVLLHVGDFGYLFEEGFVRALSDELARLGMHLLFIDGNHDNHPYLRSLGLHESGVRPLSARLGYLPRNLRWTWHGRVWGALGGAVSVDRTLRVPGASWWPEEAVTYGDAATMMDAGPLDFLMTHDLPAGVGNFEENHESILAHLPESDLVASEAHREMLREVVEVVKPQRVFSGHFHGRHTWELPRRDGGITTVELLHMDGTPFQENMLILDPATGKIL